MGTWNPEHVDPSLHAAELARRTQEANEREASETACPGCAEKDRLLALAREARESVCDMVEQRDAEIARLRAAFGVAEPWPLADVLSVLVVAADHLLDHHNCDCHAHEVTRAAAQRGREYVTALVTALRGGA